MIRTLAVGLRGGMNCGAVPLLAVSAIAWLILILSDRDLVVPRMCSGHLPTIEGLSATLDFMARVGSLPWIACSAMLMTISMMLPLQTAAIANLRRKSLAERRRRRIAVYLTAYVGVWSILLTVATLAGLVVRDELQSSPLTYLPLLGVALVWHGSAARARAANRCHAFRPIRVHGLAADLDCAAMGLRTGVDCVSLCWTYMAVMLAAAEWHLAVALLAAAAAAIERSRPRRDATWRPLPVTLGLSCIAAAAVLTV